MSTPLPAPKNKWLELIANTLDALIEGLGVDAAITAGTAYAPWLKLPVLNFMFKQLVKTVAYYLDLNAFRIVAKFTIRLQGDARMQDLVDKIQALKKPGATPKEIQDAKDAIDRLVNKNRP